MRERVRRLNRREFLELSVLYAIGLTGVSFLVYDLARNMVEVAAKSGLLERATGTGFLDKGGNEQMGSEYLKRFVSALAKRRATENDDQIDLYSKAEEIIENVHIQGGQKMHAWESEQHPGVREVSTSMSVLELVIATSNDTILKEKAKEAITSGIKDEVWVLSSSTPSGGTDGGPGTAFDMAIEVTVRKVGELVGRLKRGEPVGDVECICLGSPLAVGEVTEQWLDEVKRDGIFTAQAKLHAEMLTAELGEENVKRVVMIGHSFGGVEALLTAGEMAEQDPALGQKTTVLTDCPAPSLADPEVMAKVMKEGLAVMGQRVSDLAAKLTIGTSMEKQLRRKGIVLQKQEKLKKEAQTVVMEQVKQGPVKNWADLLVGGLKKIYVRVGINDTLSPDTNRQGWTASYNEAKEKGEAFVFANKPVGRDDVSIQPLNSGHPLNRVDVEHILRVAADLV